LRNQLGSNYSNIRRIAGYIQTIFFIIATIFIILAAFKYLTAQGDEEKIRIAKQMIMYAVAAIVIALVATGVKYIIVGLF